ncbi:MAG: hypothetical protein KF861_24720 [Planctomycetaceae bacterium]|nr:hypothetical protein [Planctomycetaceae bacterium]
MLRTVDAASTGAVDPNEIESLLRVSPDSKGQRVFAGQLDVPSLNMLGQRIGVIPEDVRRIQLGPVEAYFTCHPNDGQTRVWHIRSRLE